MKKRISIKEILLKKSSITTSSSKVQNIRNDKIEKGARDFAMRFEDVMKDLAKG